MPKHVLNKTIRPAVRSFWATWILVFVGVALAFAPVGTVMFVAGLLDEWVVVSAEALRGVERGADFIAYGGMALIAYGLLAVIGYQWLANRYVITSAEVSEHYGIIAREIRTTQLAHIRRVEKRQSVIGRLLGYGDVLYYTAGSAGVDVELENVANPQAIAREVRALLDGQHPDAPAPAASAPDDDIRQEAEEAVRERMVREEMQRIMDQADDDIRRDKERSGTASAEDTDKEETEGKSGSPRRHHDPQEQGGVFMTRQRTPLPASNGDTGGPE